MTPADQKKILDVLTRLREVGPRTPLNGICTALRDAGLSRDLQILVEELMAEWPEYSGFPLYPVPLEEKSPKYAYLGATAEEMWSPDHPYGAARLCLLDFLIEKLETNQ